ncbi:MAG: translation elongation factor Ts [bacterium]|nr:translation elongation factor Ts [Candidatus Sumerlaeota bacterium]
MSEITTQMVKELREKSGAGMMDCKKALTETGGNMQKAMNLLREKGAAIASKRSSRVAKEGVISSHITPDHKTGTLIELNSESDFVARNDEFRELAGALARHAAGAVEIAAFNETRIETGETVADLVQAIMGKIGEKIVLTRTAQLKAMSPNGFIFNYVHPPGKIGVLVEVTGGRADLAGDPAFVEVARDIAMHIAASAPLCIHRSEVTADLLQQEREICRNQALNEGKGKPEKIIDKIVEGRLNKFYAESCLLEQPFAKNPDIKVEEYLKQNSAKFGGAAGVAAFIRYKLGEMAEAAVAE